MKAENVLAAEGKVDSVQRLYGVSRGGGVQKNCAARISVAEMSSWGLARCRRREGASGKEAFVSAFLLQRTRLLSAGGRSAAQARGK